MFCGSFLTFSTQPKSCKNHRIGAPRFADLIVFKDVSVARDVRVNLLGIVATAIHGALRNSEILGAVSPCC